jgi:hypothetical protein
MPIFQRMGLLLPVTVPLLPALVAFALALVLRQTLLPVPAYES